MDEEDEVAGTDQAAEGKSPASSLTLFPMFQNELKIVIAVEFVYLHPIDRIDDIRQGTSMKE